MTLELFFLKYYVYHQQLFYPVISLLFILLIDFLSPEAIAAIVHAVMHGMLEGGWGQAK